jgi:ABC-type nitrate/sulfonate/bicarbonate transport system substrate-binding protein
MRAALPYRIARSLLGLGIAVLVALAGCAQPPATQPQRAAPAGNASAGSQPATTAPANATAQAPTAPPTKIRLAYSQIWGANVVPWLAYEAGVFAKHGLDVEMSYVASSQTVPATLSGEVDIAIGGGYAVINSRLAGSDLVMFYNAMNWYPYLLMTSPDISTPEELRGKTLGVSRFGSASDVATRVALKQLRLVPDRDVTLIQVGSLQERIAAMKSGAIAGGVAAPPDTVILRRQGFKTLYDLRNSPDKELPNSVFATERWLRANEDPAQRFVNALIEATYLAKTDRELAEKVLADYLKLDDPEAIADAYEGFVVRMERAPDLGIEAARTYLQEQAASDPRAAAAATADPGQFFDTRFMERVRASGLIERLYGGN